MFLPLALMAVLLAVGNVVFWRFDPRQPLWRRILKVVVTLAITAAVSRYLGTVGAMVWFAIVILPICLHPRHLAAAPWCQRLDCRDHREILRWPPPVLAAIASAPTTPAENIPTLDP
jgi:hypothetical protein